MKTNLMVVYGGKSVEHDVSLQTAFSVLNALDLKKYNVFPVYITETGEWCSKGLFQEKAVDVQELRASSEKGVAGSLADILQLHFTTGEKSVVFPLVHGTNGEDGTLQGLLQLLDVPYVGNGVLASALGIDKEKTKQVLKQEGILQAQYVSVRLPDWEEDPGFILTHVEKQIGYPCYIKPASLGSSVGISIGSNRQELETAIVEAFKFDEKIVVEPEVIGREMQVAVIGNEQPEASVVGEYLKERAFMDYKAKYVDGKLVPVIPASLPEQVQEEMRRIAVQAFKALDCSGLVRVDFFVTSSYEILVNEVNTLPGFTAYSMFPALWEKTNGTSYAQLIEKLIQLAQEKYERQRSIQYAR